MFFQAASDPRPVSIRGAEGYNSGRINGVFLLTDETYNGRPAYRMEGIPDYWLLYCEDAHWLVTDTEGKEANDGSGFCFSAETGIGHPTLVKAWNVDWQPQPGISATALVCTKR